MRRPNILIVLADGMQAETVRPDHPCLTPNLNALAAGGVRFRRAHTTSPTCSPARASLMTGLLPHNHGVLEVEHGRDADQSVLRVQHPHFAQALSAAGYRTGYFGKWHIERTQDISQFGWQEGAVKGVEFMNGIGRGEEGPTLYDLDPDLRGYLEGPPGYRRVLHWGVTDTPLDERYPGLTVVDAERYLEQCVAGQQPWCCCVSFSEPNEALVVGREYWELYGSDRLEMPCNFFDDLSDRPNIYQREQQIARRLSDEHWQGARRSYLGRITELDHLLERLLSPIRKADQLADSIVIFLADHGRYVGAHGFDAHNFGAFEEIYAIPLIMAGPRIAAGRESDALVSIADLCPTLCELGGAEVIETADASSFVPVLEDPDRTPTPFTTGFAEYHGTRFPMMQRVLWEDDWKFVFNGFDFDELYHLRQDPGESTNLAGDPQHKSRMESMMRQIWNYVRLTGDRAVHESHYFSLRIACVGPDP